MLGTVDPQMSLLDTGSLLEGLVDEDSFYGKLARYGRSLNAQHVYVSTYCIHNAHDACRQTCKTCQAPCRCTCHDKAG